MTGTSSPAEPAPIDMILHCPACGAQHIDAPDPEGEAHAASDGTESRWTNPPHRSHLCHGCGHIWRPADVPTNGVQDIKTRGKRDSPYLEDEQFSEAACYAVEALWQICPEVAIREYQRSVLNPNQLETLMRRFGWKPPSEWDVSPPEPCGTCAHAALKESAEPCASCLRHGLSRPSWEPAHRSPTEPKDRA